MTTYLLVGQKVRDPANRFSIPQLPLKPSSPGLGADLVPVRPTDPGLGDPE